MPGGCVLMYCPHKNLCDSPCAKWGIFAISGSASTAWMSASDARTNTSAGSTSERPYRDAQVSKAKCRCTYVQYVSKKRFQKCSVCFVKPCRLLPFWTVVPFGFEPITSFHAISTDAVPRIERLQGQKSRAKR